MQDMEGTGGPREVLQVYKKLREENRRLSELHEANSARITELAKRVASLEAENDSLAAAAAAAGRQEAAQAGPCAVVQPLPVSEVGTAGSEQPSKGAEEALQLQIAKLQEEATALQASVNHGKAEIVRLAAENEEKVRALEQQKMKTLEQQVQDLEAECTRLQSCSSSREAVASTAEKQRQRQFLEKERALEARVTEVEAQMRMSLEMQEALIEERKTLEEDKRGLEAEVLRQQDAAEELQAVLSNFFPDDDSIALQNELREVGLGPEHSPYSPRLSTSKRSSSGSANPYQLPSTNAAMQDLHLRLSTIAMKWTSDEAR